MRNRKPLALILLLALALVVTACTSSSPSPGATGQTQTTTGAAPATTAPATQASGSAPAEPEGFTYPMEPVTLTMNINEIDYAAVPDWAKDYYKWKYVEEMTGVRIEGVGGFTEGGGNTEAFFLMLAAGDLPDLMYNNWIGYPGGPEAAIKQNLIVELNDIFEQYSPNIMRMIENEPDIARDMRTDTGVYYNYPFVRYDLGRNFYGIGYRQDKLDAYGLTKPETPDELENVLRVFKDNGMEIGLTFEYRFLFTGNQGYGTALQSGFGLKSGFWVQDGKVHYGEAEPAYEDFLIWMNRLYKEGLIDPDMPSIDKATSLAKFTNGSSWAAICMSSEAVAEMAYVTDDFVGTPGKSLTTEKGTKAMFGHLQNAYSGLCSTGISPQCDNIEAAARYLDWHYSDEGAMVVQYGLEGFSYTFDGDTFTRDLDKLIPIDDETATLANRKSYGCFDTNWPMRQLDYAYYLYPEVETVHKVWVDNDMEKHLMPPLTFTPEESNEIASLLTDMETYIKEQVAMFIIGTKPLTDYENFRSTLDTLGVERIIELQQTAYGRYLSR